MNSKVMICDAGYTEDSINKAVSSVFEEFHRDWKDKKVLVKPNILAPRRADKGITTHPLLVKSVVEKLKREGANVIVGDNPGVKGYGKVIEAAQRTGILEASCGCFENIALRPVTKNIDSKYFQSVSLSSEIFEADVIVNLPKMKTHALTYITGAIKNTFGYVVGGNKMLIHSLATSPRKFAEAMLDIYSIRPPELNIMDAVVAMQGNGPANGNLCSPGKIIASNNAVSLDAVFLYMIKQRITDIPIVDIGGKRGLGTTNISDIEIKGELTRLENFKMPTTFVPGILKIFANKYISKRLSCFPEIDQSSCKNCGICMSHCPVNAMTLKDNFPFVNNTKCIKCYCCQEMCPDDAIKLEGKLLNFFRLM